MKRVLGFVASLTSKTKSPGSRTRLLPGGLLLVAAVVVVLQLSGCGVAAGATKKPGGRLHHTAKITRTNRPAQVGPIEFVAPIHKKGRLELPTSLLDPSAASQYQPGAAVGWIARPASRQGLRVTVVRTSGPGPHPVTLWEFHAAAAVGEQTVLLTA